MRFRRRESDLKDWAVQKDRRFRELMVAAQAGDRKAYGDLLRSIVPVIGRLARKNRIERDLVDDLIQDVLLTIHRARHAYDPQRSFTVWVAVITQRRSVDLMRRQQRQRQSANDSMLQHQEDVETDLPSANLDREETRRAVRQAVDTLPAGQREAVLRLALEEQSLQEASAETGRSVGSLKVNLHRALKALRGRLTLRTGE